ncbi:MarR family winged helix-turn-helix transcriptional regulator [Chitinimonas sp.]|uniref:MarR family winged helix-turn-helix transcriptional regulator n=1 Tax=Chitinimonas sp. TaxID=1934313 RepID=UPI0035B1B045
MAKSYEQAWPLWLRAQQRVMEDIEAALAQAGLPALNWYDVLWNLEQAPEQRLRMAELADELLLSRSNLTRLVDRLEKAGLISRMPCDADRRGYYAVLTPAGQALRESVWPVYRDAIASHFMRHLSDADAATLAELCRKLADG